MMKSPSEKWVRLRDLVAELAVSRSDMKEGATPSARDEGTKCYVQQADELIDILIDLDRSATLEDIGKGLDAVYGRVGG